jgi:3-deoxy-D-manno-octulosonate 8-phosphate phosphatase (KDO 8-P phosphatase)
LNEELRSIRLLVSDADGVLTDGTVALDADGRRLGLFSVRDGMGVTLARHAGLEVAVVSGAVFPALRARAAELGIRHLYDGVARKDETVRALLQRLGLRREEALMIGDDLNDLPAFREVGVAVAVADAAAEVRRAAACVTLQPGGHGAVREVVEWVLRAQGRWERVLHELFGVPLPAGR